MGIIILPMIEKPLMDGVVYSETWYGNQYCSGGGGKCYCDMSVGDVVSMGSIGVNDDANMAIIVKKF